MNVFVEKVSVKSLTLLFFFLNGCFACCDAFDVELDFGESEGTFLLTS